MALKVRNRTLRFTFPTVLRGDATFLGATVQEWDDTITGNLGKTLAEVNLRAKGNGPKRDAAKATTFDLAIFAGKHLANAK